MTPQTTNDVFWIVMRDPKTMNVTVRHDTLEAAKAEAERLCAKHNAPFYVCRIAVYGWYEPQAPEWTAA